MTPQPQQQWDETPERDMTEKDYGDESVVTSQQHCEHECAHHEVCTLNNSLLWKYLPKGKTSYIWCEDTIRLIDGDCPHDTRTSRSAPRLNTQPKGTTCEDCQRFRTKECPYPESNITITKCNSFMIDLESHDAAIAAQAREDEREWLRLENALDLFWMIGRITRAMKDNQCIHGELDGVLERLNRVAESLRAGGDE